MNKWMDGWVGEWMDGWMKAEIVLQVCFEDGSMK